jgi:transcriptional regulator GlxA family with amidase domain
VREMERTIRELSEREAQIVEEAVSYMAGHLGEPLALREVAGAVAVSPRHLTRLFNRVAQRSPMESLTALRLDRAAELLRTSDKRVTDVCTEVGYSSLSHFVRLFTRRFGLTPGRYARQARSRPA